MLILLPLSPTLIFGLGPPPVFGVAGAATAVPLYYAGGSLCFALYLWGGGGFIAQQRNAVLVGGTGTGKTHLAIAIARSCIRSGVRGRFYNVVDLVNRLETETRNGRQGRLADHLTRMDFIILDELGYLPFAQSGGQLLFHLVSRLYERTSIIVTKNPAKHNICFGAAEALDGKSQRRRDSRDPVETIKDRKK